MQRIISAFILLLILSSTGLHAQKKATILDHKDRIKIKKLYTLNSTSRETNLSITPDGKYLFFMSLRGGQPWSNSFMMFKGDSVYDGDIWYSRKVNGKWALPKCMPYGINTMQGEDEPNISPDGKRVYFQSWNGLWEQTGGPYYVASRKNESWGSPIGMGGGVTEFFMNYKYHATDGMAISPDEKTMVVAVGKDYDGNMDLYMSKKTKYGWSYCKRMGISTIGDDRSVFISGDGKTIYFASDGYKGYGGLDIFKTTLKPDGTIGEVINIGKPFNTAGDDYGFILTADGMESYFVRNGDIYYADLKEADVRIRPSASALKIPHTIKGTVRDSSNWKGLKAEVIVLDAKTRFPVKKLKTSADGKYTFTIPNKNGIYDEIVVAEGFKKKRRRIQVNESSYSQTIKANFLLSKTNKAANTPPPITKKEKIETPPKIIAKKDQEPEETSKEPVKTLPPLSKMEPPTKNKNEIDVKVEKGPIPKAPDPYDFSGIARNNLILLLDVSASMRKSDRLPVLKEALNKLLTHMRAEDRISVVAYASDARVVIDGVSAIQKDYILQSIDRLGGSGGTKGKSALKKAYKLAEENFILDGNNRIILATDGFFEIYSLFSTAEKLASNNISLSVFSFGVLSKSRHAALEELAQKGAGNYANINRSNIDTALLKEAKAVRK
ncbi:MAG: VWA domain-containing protein [Bacteroidia bacterium]|nr:VWA domain-containing protein [Bacteroidia bacterium]